MDFVQDTIVAVSSPLGAAARTILRLSGTDALPLARRVMNLEESIPSAATYRACEGTIALGDAIGARDLSATLFLMRAPRSYTREDVVELHIPGNPAVVGEVLSRLCRAGARPARPGEFTARAFAAGRIDLVQAEAVMAVISAGGARSLAAAQRLLEGRLSGEIGSLAARLRELLGRVELAIDFSQEDVPLVAPAEAGAAARQLRDDIVRLARQSRDAAQLDGDLRLALVGRPNVGKSSLFNALAGAERAIVTAVPGTTRDELREHFILAGTRFVLSDTAGLDDAVAEPGAGRRTPVSPAGGEARLRSAARERTLAALMRADLVLVVVEAGEVVGEAAGWSAELAAPSAVEEQPQRAGLRRLLATLTVPAILVVSKCDLLAAAPAAEAAGGASRPVVELARRALGDVAAGVPLVATSARTGQGLDDLRATIVETLRLGGVDRGAEGQVVAARHRRCLESAAEALERAVELCARASLAARGEGIPLRPDTAPSFSEELLALELREALDALGQITGATSPQEVLNEIFSRFCIGK